MNGSIVPISLDEIKPWIMERHYAKRMPSISYSYGLMVGSDLVGVVSYGSPPSPSLCVGICGEEYRGIVVELNRLCLKNNNKNEASYLVSNSMKMIPTPKIIVSYADTSKNHHGYIYQACNFLYTGLSAKRTERFDPLNPNKHSKSCCESMDYSDLEVRRRPQKHRYVYFLGTKKEKKQLLACLNYEILPYPKGDNVNYDTSKPIPTQSRMF